MTTEYPSTQPERAQIDALSGPAVLDFGTNWCGHCRAAQPLVADALAAHGNVRHIQVEDGSGRVLGRGYGVRLWPTLVFLRDGKEVTRLVRPRDRAALLQALSMIDPAAP